MRVLTVDDSFDWLNIHSNVLSGIFEDSLELISANSASEAIDIYKSDYRENPFDLVITDLQMEGNFEPLYAGEWLIKEIQNLNASQPILIVSSCFNIEQIANTYNVDYISKRLIISDLDAYQLKLEGLYS